MENKTNDTNDRELSLSRTLNAPIELVWEIFSSPEHISNWWGPDGFTNTIHLMEFKPGGRWHFTMHGPDGTDYDNEDVFTEIIEHRKIVFDHVSQPHHTTTITFEAQGDKTHLTWYMLFDSTEQFELVAKKYGAVEGLHQNIARLELYLSKQSV
jgi:uncharacterized protein YndB with AHSA1/START domain